MARIRRTKLENGIEVITDRMNDAESVTIGVWVKTGSRHEEAKHSGISHFIEHMLFKGTEKRSALDIAREIESVGGVLNAFTGREFTCFYAKVLSKDLPRAINLLADIFTNSVFDSNELDRERSVVLQEIKMVEDTPDDLIHDLFVENFWKTHPLGRSILGVKRTIGMLKREDITGYIERRYYPGNVFIAVAGRFDNKKTEALLERAFGGISRKGSKVTSNKPVHRPGVKLFKRDLEQVHFCLGVPVPPQPDQGRYTLYLLNTMLGGGMSSRLFQEIRENRGLAYSVYSYLSLVSDGGSLVCYAGTSAESFSEVLALVLKEFKKLRRGVGARELTEAKNQLKGGMLLGLETSDNRMMKLAKDQIYFGRTVSISEIVRNIDAVDLDDVKRAARRFLTPSRATLAAIGKVKRSGVALELKN